MTRSEHRAAKTVTGILAGLVVAAAALVAVPNLTMVVGQGGNVKSFDDLVVTDAAGGTYDCIVILGAAVNPDGTPSGVLQDRLDTGAEIYAAGVAPKIIVSGDDQSDSSYDEVSNMKAYLVERCGIPSEDIFCDHAGLNTYDSMYRLKNVFDAEHAVIVTQTYHLYRALYDANSLGVESVGVASDLHSYQQQAWFDLREIGARMSDFKKVAGKETSTYLSETVDLDQSGDVTSW